MPDAMTEQQIAAALRNLPGWDHADNRLRKSFRFHSFREAMSFIVRIGFEAEAIGHHPELFNVYNQVQIALNTHDAGGKVTQKDIDLATAIEKINWLPN